MPRPRDPFLDGLRSLAIVRVLLLHTAQMIQLPWVLTFSFFMPGMPLVFFVSGALAATSLGSNGTPERRRFWSGRARRLFFPYWALAAFLIALCFAADAFASDPRFDFTFEQAWRWVLPLAGPRPSPALDHTVWHLWFLSSLILMLATAPLTLALHRRRPWLGVLAFGGAGIACELALLAFPELPLPGVLRNTLLFGTAFQLGYGYAQGAWDGVRRGSMLAAALLLGAFALALHERVAPGTMIHSVPLAHVSLGLAFLALWLGLRDLATKLFALRWFARLRAAVNPRAYTIFLWGPLANEAAWRLARESSAPLALYLVLSLVLLLAAMRVLGRIEDWAARRGRLLQLDRAKSARETRQAA